LWIGIINSGKKVIISTFNLNHQMSRKKTKGSKKAQPQKLKTFKSTTSFWKTPSLIIPAVLILLFTSIIFSPSLKNDFVNWDDDVNLTKNENLRDLSFENIKRIFNPATGTIIGNYNPLPIFTFLIEKELLGGHDGQNFKAGIYHINNLLLHLFVVLLVFRILLMLRLSKEAAIIGALLFAIHPMRVESVAWVTERKDVLLGVFYFSAIYTYIRHLNSRNNKKHYFYATVILFVLALFSKIQAVSLPLSMLALDYYFKRPLKWGLILEKWLFFVLSLLFGLFGIYFLSQGDSLAINSDLMDYSIIDRIIIGFFSFCIYLIKLVIPYELAPMYPYPPKPEWYFWFSIIGVSAVGYFLYKWYNAKRYALVFGFSFFIVNIVFLLQILGAGQGFKADRFTYIPYFGLFFLFGYAYDWWIKNKASNAIYAQAGIGIYIIIFSFISWKQCGIWKNGETLWTHLLKYYDNTTLPWGNRGQYYRETGQFQKAIADFSQGLELENNAGLYNSRGKTYFDFRRPQEAINDYTNAINLKPNDPEFLVNRGAAYGMLGKMDAALADFTKGLEVDPEYENAFYNRSLVYTALRRYDQALQDQETYLRLDPFNPEIWYQKGVSLRQLGRQNEALSDFNRAIELGPGHSLIGNFYMDRARLHLTMGQKALARMDVQAAQQRGVQVDQNLLQRVK
jgi:tetratricopeptide (TPR) repeat protein